MIYTTKGGARRVRGCAAVVARRVLRVLLSRLYFDSCVWCAAKLIPSGDERASLELNVSSKYECTIIEISAG
jgi:hypothetical protein